MSLRIRSSPVNHPAASADGAGATGAAPWSYRPAFAGGAAGFRFPFTPISAEHVRRGNPMSHPSHNAPMPGAGPAQAPALPPADDRVAGRCRRLQPPHPPSPGVGSLSAGHRGGASSCPGATTISGWSWRDFSWGFWAAATATRTRVTPRRRHPAAEPLHAGAPTPPQRPSDSTSRGWRWSWRAECAGDDPSANHRGAGVSTSTLRCRSRRWKRSTEIRRWAAVAGGSIWSRCPEPADPGSRMPDACEAHPTPLRSGLQGCGDISQAEHQGVGVDG